MRPSGSAAFWSLPALFLLASCSTYDPGLVVPQGKFPFSSLHVDDSFSYDWRASISKDGEWQNWTRQDDSGSITMKISEVDAMRGLIKFQIDGSFRRTSRWEKDGAIIQDTVISIHSIGSAELNESRLGQTITPGVGYQFFPTSYPALSTVDTTKSASYGGIRSAYYSTYDPRIFADYLVKNGILIYSSEDGGKCCPFRSKSLKLVRFNGVDFSRQP